MLKIAMSNNRGDTKTYGKSYWKSINKQKSPIFDELTKPSIKRGVTKTRSKNHNQSKTITNTKVQPLDPQVFMYQVVQCNKVNGHWYNNGLIIDAKKVGEQIDFVGYTNHCIQEYKINESVIKDLADQKNYRNIDLFHKIIKSETHTIFSTVAIQKFNLHSIEYILHIVKNENMELLEFYRAYKTELLRRFIKLYAKSILLYNEDEQICSNKVKNWFSTHLSDLNLDSEYICMSRLHAMMSNSEKEIFNKLCDKSIISGEKFIEICVNNGCEQLLSNIVRTKLKYSVSYKFAKKYILDKPPANIYDRAFILTKWKDNIINISSIQHFCRMEGWDQINKQIVKNLHSISGSSFISSKRLLKIILENNYTDFLERLLVSKIITINDVTEENINTIIDRHQTNTATLLFTKFKMVPTMLNLKLLLKRDNLDLFKIISAKPFTFSDKYNPVKIIEYLKNQNMLDDTSDKYKVEEIQKDSIPSPLGISRKDCLFADYIVTSAWLNSFHHNRIPIPQERQEPPK
jgi:hypothetical protein